MKRSLKVNALLNILKQVCTILFPLITFPYISRVLGAENYGKYTFSASIISYYTLIASLGTSSYAVREGARIREDIGSITKFCSEVFTINLCSTSIAYLLMGISLFIVPLLRTYSLLIIILSTTLMLNTLGTDWINTVFEEFDYLTIRYIVFQILSMLLMFIFVRSREDYYIYAIITVFASAGANVCNFVHVRRFVHFGLVRVYNAKKHLLPMLILLCNSIAITVYVNSDITMLGFLSNDTEVGVYSAVVRIYTLIKQLIVAVIVVLVPRLSFYLGQSEKEQYQKHINMIINVIFTLTIPLIIGVIILSKNIILFLGGDQYVSGSKALVILSLAIFFSIMAYVYANLILVLMSQEKKFLLATTVGAIINVILNLFFIPEWGINGAAITTLISEFTVCLICGWYSRKYCRVIIDKRNLMSVFFGSIMEVLLCFYIIRLGLNSFITILLAVVTSGISYVVVQIAFKNRIIIGLIKRN